MQIELDPEKDFHVAIDGVVTALSLDALDEAYQADSISEETLIWQEGLDEWMRLDVLLASLSEQEHDEAPDAPGPALDENTYSVMVAPEEIRSMTLEVLGDAFRAGAVTAETLVWQPGYAEWVPLSVVIAAVTHQHVSLAPSVAPTQQGTSPSVPAVSQHAPAPSVAPSIQPSIGAAPVGNVSAAPSVAASIPAPSSIPSAPNSLAPTAASIAPMAPSVGFAASADSLLDDLEYAPLKGSGSPWIKRSAIALGSLAAVFVIYQGASDSAGAEPALPDGVALKAASAAGVPEPEAEPSAWEQEKAMMEKARLADEAASKNGTSKADAFGARLAGEPEPKKAAPTSSKSKWKPKAKKTSAANKRSQYDPMNGAL